MSAYFKVIFRSIRQSLGRFLAILLITALGVGFFTGLKVSMPSFIKTGNEYIKDNQMYDIRLISTIGFDEEDIDKLSKTDNVRACEGALFKDAEVRFADKEDYFVLRLHSFMENINMFVLEEGRLPQSGDEIVVDGYNCDASWVGKTLVVRDQDGLNYAEYKVVGTGRSPYYLNFQRGTSDVGNGSVSIYAYADKSAFDYEYYTEAYVKLDSDLYMYSDEYEDLAETEVDRIKTVADIIEYDRFMELKGDAINDYEDGLTEYYDSLKDAQKELTDGVKELEDARVELIDADKELADAKIELDDAQKEISDGESKLATAGDQIEDGRKQLEEGKKTLDESKAALDSALAQVEEGEKYIPELQAKKNELVGMREQLVPAQEQLAASVTAYEAALASYVPFAGEEPIYTEEYLNGLKAQYEEVSGNLQAVEAGIAQIDAQLAAIADGRAQYEAGKAQYDAGVAEYEKNLTAFQKAESDYNSGRRDLSDGKTEYEDGLTKYEDGLKEYEDGLKEYADGRIELIKGQRELGEQMASASLLLDYYKNQIDSLEDPEVFSLGRDTNIGYVSFENDSKIVDDVAAVFPVFFFAIAALVCSTTMQRMVSDERGQIGTMRSLGYSGFAIVMKYVTYSGLASVTGCILGYLVGSKLFPAVIWKAYRMMYGFAPIVFKNDIGIFILSLIVSILCSVGATVFTCLSEFTEEPAQLVRPKAPTPGKRILLERMTFIWKRLHFLHKVSARNVFRFKKRMWMMIIGIAGCTALLLAAFGIKDSCDNLMFFQYDEIQTYDISLLFDGKPNRKKVAKELKALDEKFAKTTGDEFKSESCYVTFENVKHNSKAAIREVTLIASDAENITEFINLHKDGQSFAWPSDGKVSISMKLADTNNLKPGDKITFEYGDEGRTFELEIESVFENYVNHYALINDKTYEQAFGEDYDPSDMLIKLPSKYKDQGMTYASKFASKFDVRSWSAVAEMRKNFEGTMEQLNNIVILVIFCAGMLAFIVLFNLNNINITERVREIATLKVLGFNRGETGSYVFRENFILVFIGFLFGVPLGIVFHRFIIAQIKMDLVAYKVLILPKSYVFALILVLLFSLVVDLVMRGKIEKIDMAESLKSIE